ncbi:hypothetical protein QWI18_18800 [Pseudomonas sp. W2Oct36]|uniref:hypothetical protein n=1 Tax=Pseudomonas sp. W2Oct36 TaxID=1215284 RepID=UPI0034E0B0BA
MFENMKHIKNPLTLISLFAGVAEVSGAGILPFIKTPENQLFYIYFLMGFPTLTVVLFFVTLNFNHKTLYAPSDYKDEQNFVNPFRTATSVEVDRKLKDETSEVQRNTDDASTSPVGNAPNSDATKAEGLGDADLAVKNGSIPHPSPTPDQPTTTPEEVKSKASPAFDPKKIDTTESYELQHRNLMGDVVVTEKLAIRKLATWLNLDFRQDVVFSPTNSNGRYVFDAVARNKDCIDVAEVKLFTNSFNPNRFLKTFDIVDSISRSISRDDKLTLHLVVVMGRLLLSPAEIKNAIRRVAAGYNFRVRVHVTTKEDLENDDIPFL